MTSQPTNLVPLPPVKWKNHENPAQSHHLVERPGHRAVFLQPPLISYRRDRNLRDIVVHTSDTSQPCRRARTSPCSHILFRTCHHISTDTNLPGPLMILHCHQKGVYLANVWLSLRHPLPPLSSHLHGRNWAYTKTAFRRPPSEHREKSARFSRRWTF